MTYTINVLNLLNLTILIWRIYMSNHNTNSIQRSPTNRNQTNSGVRLFLSFFWRNPKSIAVALVLLLVNTILVLLPAILIARSLEILLTEGYGRSFIIMAAIIIVVAILSYITSAISSYSFMTTTFALERDVRQEFFDSLVDSSLTFHDQNNSSRLLSLGMNEVHFMSGGAMMLRIIIQSMISTIIVIWYFDKFFESFIILSMAISFVFYFYAVFSYAKKVGPIRTERSNLIASLTEQSQEIFRGIQVVKSHSSHSREIERFRKTNAVNAKLSEREGQLRAFYLPGLILIAIMASIFMLSLSLVQNGTMRITQLVEVMGLLLTIQVLNFTIPSVSLTIRGALINAARISTKIESAKKMSSSTKQTEAPNQSFDHPIREIKFNDVSFAYPGYSKVAVKRLDFTINSGERIVLLGGPGSGKSSLLKLILGLYDAQEGSISFDGTDIREIDEYSLRKNVAMVEQDIFLFSGTIRDNISFANSSATDAEIINALTTAQAYEFIEKLDNGIDTIVGERGATLSGGQKQRLAIARALLANPQILLLDDSSSAVDSKTESLISKALQNLGKNRTTITVAQRLNVLREADKIIFLEKGEVIGIGKHESLYHSNPKYRSIFDLLPDSTKGYTRSSTKTSIKIEQEVKGGD